MSERCEQIDKV